LAERMHEDLQRAVREAVREVLEPIDRA